MQEARASFAAVKTIQKKLLGKSLSYWEIYHLMDEIAQKRLSDILTTYFVAASFKEGFSPEELYYLTRAMVETGVKLKFDGIVADKHSTGGVAGTRTTMIVVPIVASMGFKIPKTSSRAITSPAGTADVMEVLAPVVFTVPQIQKIVEEVGGCIVWGGHLGIAPADDVIIRVEEPLSFESYDKVIVSIMAKKVAASTNHLIVDIPVGETMKIRHYSDAIKIEAKFRELGKRFGMKVLCDINETRQPAGSGVGPALEARDVLYVLEQHPSRPMDLENKAIRLAGKLLDICFKDAKVEKDGMQEAKRAIIEGDALRKFRQIVHAQGGTYDVSSGSLAIPNHKLTVAAGRSGTIRTINNFNLNTLAKILGAPADKYAGIYMARRLGERVSASDTLVQFYTSEPAHLTEAEATLKNFPIYEIEE